MSELDREMLADEGRALDGCDCLVDGCGGVLVHQDSINIMCEEGCGECWSLVVTDDAWELHNTEAECEHKLPILETDGGEKLESELQHADENIGELADGILGDLTSPQEELEIALHSDNENWPEQLRDALNQLSDAQDKANEIRRRFEEQVGPI